MNTKIATTTLRTRIIGLLVLLNIGLFGCSTVGKVIPQERRIPFADTQQADGTFEKGSITINYSYSLSGTNMTLNGKAHYLGGADVLDIRVVFLDAQGAVIEQKLIYGTNYRASRGQQGDRTFEKTLAVPTRTTAFSFTYAAEDRSGHR